MAVDFFLELDGIKGESADEAHKDQIDVMSWSWGASQTGTFAYGGGGGAGKVSVQDFHFTMKMNKATPFLILACCTGKHIPKATFYARKAGEKQQEYMNFKFSDLLITSYQTGGGGDEPIESIAMNFAKFQIEYKPQKADGSLDAGIPAGWDLKANVPV